MTYVSVLRYKSARYLWCSLLLVLGSVALYFSQIGAVQPPNGGSWQGYVLGTIGALIILWLSCLGVRKRRYHSARSTLQGWTSAHIYLGLALLVCATLHSAGQLGWNVHSLCYLIMCAVIFSGIFGVLNYTTLPSAVARNRGGASRSALFAELFELNQQATIAGSRCLPEVAEALSSALQRTPIGGGVRQQLLQVDRSQCLLPASRDQGPRLCPNRDQQALIDFVAGRIPQADKRSEARELQALVSVLVHRQTVLRKIRKDISLQGWLKLWLYTHIPMTVALLATLVVHIASTFYYW